jgi:hypothetical protein
MTRIQFRRGYSFAFSRRDFARVCQEKSRPQIKGAGNAGRSTRPQPGRPKKMATSVTSHHGHIGFTRHSPRDGVNKLPRALPGDRLICHRRRRKNSANLTPAPGCQDHTPWPSASAPFVNSASTSTASRSAYRDDREPPPWRNGTEAP